MDASDVYLPRQTASVHFNRDPWGGGDVAPETAQVRPCDGCLGRSVARRVSPPIEDPRRDPRYGWNVGAVSERGKSGCEAGVVVTSGRACIACTRLRGSTSTIRSGATIPSCNKNRA